MVLIEEKIQIKFNDFKGISMSYDINGIERYGIPTKMDQFPYGTACKVYDHNKDIYDLYLQVAQDENNPNWELIETFNKTSNIENIHTIISSRLKKRLVYD